MNGLKYSIKLILAYFLYFTGILRIYKAIKLKNKAVVLMYHRVLSGTEKIRTFSHNGIIVESDTFEKHIRCLRDSFNVITLEEFNDRIRNRIPFKKNTCLITFDDGWKDNYIYAYPILKKYELPATIFLPVNFIGNKNQFWQERLTGILCKYYHLSNEDNSFKSKCHKILEKYNLQDILSYPEVRINALIAEKAGSMKKKSYLHIQNMLSEMSAFLNDNNEHESCDTFLRWDEVKQMKTDGISFGSHGMNHKILTKISLSEAEYEIVESRRVIEKEIDNEIPSISYPNGDYGINIIELVRSNGYQTAFSTDKGFVDITDNPFSLKRINIHNDITNNIPMFLSHILGVF